MKNRKVFICTACEQPIHATTFFCAEAGIFSAISQARNYVVCVAMSTTAQAPLPPSLQGEMLFLPGRWTN